ncbi:MAG: sugar diacid recognition domain-containing protein [Lachnospiraceae bacterium]|nr:sugar diacid recognition domain-containing protein [Lachnospiraceae bacterium]
MKLSLELAQSIIDRTHQIIDYTINIMDPNAIIIASSDPSRVGEFHHGAKRVMETNQAYIMDENEAPKYASVIPGISLPIRFNDEILGVIGIGSGSESAKTYGSFIQYTTELLLEQFYMKEELMAEKHVKEEFLQRLLSESWHSNTSYFTHQIEQNDFDISQSYLIVAVESLEIFKAVPGEEYMPSDYEHRKNSLTERLYFSLHYTGIQIAVKPKYIFLMVPCFVEVESEQQKFIQKFISDLNFILKQNLNVSSRIAIGGISSSMKDIHKHYRHAIYTLKLATLFAKEEQIIYFSDVYTEYMALSIPAKKRKSYYQDIIGPLLSPDDKDTHHWIFTLETYFNLDTSIVNTAKALFIHRNTLLFRLSRIQELTGFHPQHFKDAAKLHLAIILWKLDNLMEETAETFEEDFYEF